jgi:hypothetical protein
MLITLFFTGCGSIKIGVAGVRWRGERVFMTPRHHGENFMDGWDCVVGFRCVKILNEYTLSQFRYLNTSSTRKTNAAEYTIVDKNITHDN